MLKISPAEFFVPDNVKETNASRRRREISRAAEPRQGLFELLAPAFRLLPLLALAFDHLFGRVAHETLIGKLAVDPRDIAHRPRELFVEPRLLGSEVDYADERQRRHLATHHELNRASRHRRRHREPRQPPQPLDHVSPPSRT